MPPGTLADCIPERFTREELDEVYGETGPTRGRPPPPPQPPITTATPAAPAATTTTFEGTADDGGRGGVSQTPSHQVCFKDVCRGGVPCAGLKITKVPCRDQGTVGGPWGQAGGHGDGESGASYGPALPAPDEAEVSAGGRPSRPDPTATADRMPPAPVDSPVDSQLGPAENGGRGGVSQTPSHQVCLDDVCRGGVTTVDLTLTKVPCRDQGTVGGPWVQAGGPSGLCASPGPASPATPHGATTAAAAFSMPPTPVDPQVGNADGGGRGGVSQTPSHQVCIVDVCRGGVPHDDLELMVVPYRDQGKAGGPWVQATATGLTGGGARVDGATRRPTETSSKGPKTAAPRGPRPTKGTPKSAKKKRLQKIKPGERSVRDFVTWFESKGGEKERPGDQKLLSEGMERHKGALRDSLSEYHSLRGRERDKKRTATVGTWVVLGERWRMKRPLTVLEKVESFPSRNWGDGDSNLGGKENGLEVEEASDWEGKLHLVTQWSRTNLRETISIMSGFGEAERMVAPKQPPNEGVEEMDVSTGEPQCGRILWGTVKL